MTTREVLIAARGLIAKGWTQGSFARASDGVGTSFNDHDACSWCSLGALMAATPVAFDRGIAMSCLRDAIGRDANGRGSIQLWNDAPERTQAEVLAAFDKAIEAQS
jgi:hypothetical protein